MINEITVTMTMMLDYMSRCKDSQESKKDATDFMIHVSEVGKASQQILDSLKVVKHPCQGFPITLRRETMRQLRVNAAFGKLADVFLGRL